MGFLLTGCTDPSSGELGSTELEEESVDAVSEQDMAPIEDWSIDFTREQLKNQALAVAHEYFEANQGPIGKVNYYFEDSISETRREKIIELSETTLGAFHDDAYPEQQIIAGQTQAFMSQIIVENDLVIPPQPVEGTTSICGVEVWEDLASGCNWDNASWLGFGEEEEKAVHALNNVVPHELFHSVQSQLSGGSFPMNYIPQWFLEGSAEFMGYAMTDYTGYFDYDDLAEEDWYYLPNPATGLEFWSNPPSFRGVPFEWYTLGQLATEYIIVNAGMEGLLSIFENIGQEMPFDEAFEDATGVSLTKFYALFDISYAKMLEKGTGRIRTFENRICPERFEWDCSIDNYKNLSWWSMYANGFDLPDEPENSDHGWDTSQFKANFTYEDCAELLRTAEWSYGDGGIAASFIVRENLGLNVEVSTEFYARQSHLDSNFDGVVCGPGDDL